MLEVRLLGPFELRADATPVVLASTRAQSLLAYLALRHGAPQRRDRVAFLLWPESTGQQARTNLRHVLHTLRGAIPHADRHLRATAQTLALHDVSTDVQAFDAALADKDDAAAANLYRGDLLDGWYDDWVAAEREEYRRRMMAALDRLVPMREAAGDLGAATRYAERARALDRLAEAPYRMLIRLHDAQGDRARAVRIYHECVAMLEDELGVGPSAETRALYEALLPSGGTAERAAGAGAFVGRRTERRRLTELWRDAGSGPPHLVVVSGEPGIGKTRLVEEFRQWAAQRGAVVASARSYRAEGTLAYAPVVSWLRDLGVARWRGHLQPAQLAALAPLLPELGVEPAPADPGARLRLFDAAMGALHARGKPVLLIADDLHAADSPTLQFLHYLLRAEAPGPVLVAATARLAETDPGHPVPALLAGLAALGRCTELPLDRLNRAETAVLAGRLGHRLEGADAERLHAETEGSPLFVVEALRAGWDGDVLTARVQAVLEARLLQLTPGARELAGVAAAAGSSVSVDVLALVHPGGADRVVPDLDELWRRQVLLTGGGDTYDFSHDKLREMAYRLLSPAQRRRNHGLLAGALREVYAERPDDVAGQVAAHLHAAGARAEAVDWYLRAARAAQRLYADAEAADLLWQAWQVVRGQDRELAVLTAIPGPLSSAEGYASPRLRTVLDRAFAIAAEPTAPLLRAQAMAVLSRGDFDAAVRYGTQLRDLGDGDDVLAVEGDFVRGVAAAWRNDAVAARAHLEAAIARYRPENRPAHLLAYGQDPQVFCLVRLAHVHFCLGDPAEARRLQRRGLDLARSIGHPFTLGGAVLFAALLDLDLADLPALRERVAELAGLRERLEAPPIRLFADATTGYLEVLDGEAGPGLARIDAALGDPGRATAPGLPAMLLRIRLAATLAAGRAGEARATAARLLAGGVRIWDGVARETLGGTLAERPPAEGGSHDHHSAPQFP
jgi:DNA-binding SARP family transcriptional activator